MQSLRTPEIDGDIFINNVQVYDTAELRNQVAFCQQTDLAHPTLTVRQTIDFAVRVNSNKRNSLILTEAEISHRVDEVLRIYELEHVQHSFVGSPSNQNRYTTSQSDGFLSKAWEMFISLPGVNWLFGAGPTRGISGGELKRLCVAVTACQLRPVISCDEVTSGLDSATAASVMRALRTYADTGKTVIVTLHQPSADICAMLDRVMLMSRGRCVYYGPVLSDSTKIRRSSTSSAAAAAEFIIESLPEETFDGSPMLLWFAMLGFKCPSHHNPADFVGL